ncbi:MAG: hypothetical protein C0392_12645 [Syntrophus sp. (in: bacteria)]|nr:hypothetical protein [Syntrophus sp. (in: bacteria)]
MRFKVPVISGVILLLLVSGFFYLRTTPYYSIYQLAGAINSHDPEKALKYIDVDSIVEGLVKNLSANENALKPASRKAIITGISMNMASIKEGITQYIITSIQSGDAGNATKRESTGGIGLGNFNINRIHKNIIWDLDITTKGTTAFVTMKGKPGQKARMIRTPEGYWKIVEIIIDAPVPGKE